MDSRNSYRNRPRNRYRNVQQPEVQNTNIPSTSNPRVLKYIISFLLLITLVCIFIIIVFAAKYYLEDCHSKHSFYDYLKTFKFSDVCKVQIIDGSTECNIPSGSTDGSIDGSCSQINKEKEVFHISNQRYTYDQAKCKCAVYGAKLATHDQIIDAYTDGANWCSYGWSGGIDGVSGANAYYVTQQDSFDDLQKRPVKDHNNCGKVGINGGYFQNKDLKFGVNCYGIKPENDTYVPIHNSPTGFCDLPQNVNSAYKLNDDSIVAFNNGKWSTHN
jgi:hypothetical protein